MGDFNSNDQEIFGFITKVTAEPVGCTIEFRPLSEGEFSRVREFAIANKGKLIYSSYDESMKNAVEMHLLDGYKEFAARKRAAKGK